MNDAAAETDAIVGIWHLVDLEADEGHLPAHRVDLAIRRTPTGLAGAILSRRDGAEVGLVVVQLDGPILRLQMRVRGQDEAADSPWLILKQIDERFEGRWHNAANEAMGPALKLVRARKSGEGSQHGV